MFRNRELKIEWIIDAALTVLLSAAGFFVHPLAGVLLHDFFEDNLSNLWIIGCMFILTAFMKTIPKEVEESAEIDGCNRYQNFFKMILPLSKSGLSTLAIYNGVSMWNEFAFANTLLITPEKKTLPLALGQFKGEHSLDIPIILAVLTLSVLPMITLFIVFQDKLVKGMMAGAVKG